MVTGRAWWWASRRRSTGSIPRSAASRRSMSRGPTFDISSVPELELVRRAVADDLPVLGICRGMQLLNVALGGTLHQHLPEVLGHSRHYEPDPDDSYRVRLAPGTLVACAAGAETLDATQSQHHQGVVRLGRGLVASGWADDGLTLAIEHSGRGRSRATPPSATRMPILSARRTCCPRFTTTSTGSWPAREATGAPASPLHTATMVAPTPASSAVIVGLVASTRASGVELDRPHPLLAYLGALCINRCKMHPCPR